jgi:hypothetical protein
MSNETDQVNEGEGNKTAARNYNRAQRRFVESHQVEEKAREAERALDGPEAKTLAEAEAIGRSHIAEEDPAVRRDYHARIRARAYEIWEEEGRPHGRDREHWQQAEAADLKS